MRQLKCNSPQDAVELIRREDVNLTYFRIPMPARSEIDTLLSMGTFTSPEIILHARHVGITLIPEVERYFAIRLPTLSAAAQSLGRELCRLYGSDNVYARLLLWNPRTRRSQVGSRINHFHIDFNPIRPRQEFVRLIWCLAGPATEWVNEADTDRELICGLRKLGRRHD